MKVRISTQVAGRVAARFPETFETPPTLSRQPTGISTIRNRPAAARICISRFQP